MSKALISGANIVVPTATIKVNIQIFGIDGSDLDFSAYILSHQTQKVRGDDDMIFYGQSQNQAQTVSLSHINTDTVVFVLNLPSISMDVGKIAICATMANKNQNFSHVDYLRLKLIDDHHQSIALAQIKGDGRNEAALILGEFYRYQQNWKFRLVAQGFNGGLKPLSENFGVEIADESSLPPDLPNSNISEPINTTSDITSNISNALKDIFSSPLKMLEKHKKQKEFLTQLNKFLLSGRFTHQDMQYLDKFCFEHDLDKELLFKQSSSAINNFLHYTLANMMADHFMSEDEQRTIHQLCNYFKPDQSIISEINTTIKRVNHLAKIKKGDVQPIYTNEIITKNSEIIYLHQRGVQLRIQRKNANNNECYRGDLFITSERIIYKSDKPKNILISNIIAYESNKNMIFITTKTASNSAEFYIGKDVDFTEAYIEQSVKRFHRQIDLRQSTNNTRHIAQEIRNTVWQRCNGKCVECESTSYLEFDHIIPFSKGGSNSENNIQLLCRACNLSKGDRI